jgi:hypothetical protein
MKAQRGSRCAALLFLQHSARWVLVVNATPRPFYPRENPVIHCIRGWVGFKAGLEQMRKFSLPPGFDARTDRLVASRYITYTNAYLS